MAATSWRLAAPPASIVHSSVSGAGGVDLSDFDEQRWGGFARHYWRSKIAVERLVREAGFPHWTILRPAAFMENLIRPSYYFADFTSDRLLIAIDPDALVPFVAVDDLGAAAAAAFHDHLRFDHVELELAGDVLSYRGVAQILSAALGSTIVPPGGPEKARAEGLMPEMASAQEFTQAHRVPVSPDAARAPGISTTSFQQWVERAFPASDRDSAPTDHAANRIARPTR